MKTHNTAQVKFFACLLTPLLAVACAKTQFLPVDLVQEVFVNVDDPNKVINSSEVVSLGNKKVDFLLVLDDSNSMLPELEKLSARMASFVSYLEEGQVDWQMCVTTTRASMFGIHLPWKSYSPASGVPLYVLKKGGGDLNTIFQRTINSVVIGGGDSGDERAIKSAFVSFQNLGPCYRQGAAVSVIAISDEDERSVGGDPSKLKAKDAEGAYLPLGPEDQPKNLVAQAQASFGTGVRFTFHSIIVKPNDKTCESKQDLEVSPSHPGHIYSQMSALTGGGIGSICDADYSNILNTFKDKVVNSLNQVALQCEPLSESLKVKINGKGVSNFKLEKKVLKFASSLFEMKTRTFKIQF